MINTIQILGNSSNKKNLTSDPVLAGGYYTHNNGIQTLTVYTGNNFHGRIYLLGTLEHEECELKNDSNWFTIPLTDNTDYIEFPIYDNTDVKTDDHIISNEKVYSYKFTCLPVYIKCKIDRTYIKNWETQTIEQLGNIRKLILSY